ncbi:sugar ABC transporter permease [Rhodococcus sp. Leaf7]|uniref:ABC transporter permease n=1 Tax=unclassified Rhodococcus (in: high G+C Gram-positive bacteria) TaxID=192944 RepID=UPI0006FF79E7|nr:MULTISPECIES: ABC transporter permease [unclassified Rhodococcus (in: high G+C Gram-positive bacteria)]KQU07169.1 sugar ABC transporter permease [Rhodococcus sp. Leaf7]KQU42687.1 sugar ABC transporter permease [Rhodococcus sp. Leaf247]
MTTQSHEEAAAAPASPPPGGSDGAGTRTKGRKLSLGLDRFSGLYVWVAIIVLFAIWIPDTFMTQGNFRIVAGDQAITAMLAIGLIVPLAAGVFDLSIAGVMGFSVAMVSYQLSQGISTPIAIVTTLLCGALIGAVNGFVVVKLHVDSFIATLGMSSILLAGTYWVTDGKQITEGFTDGFLDMGSKPFLGLPLPFFYMIAVAAVMYVLLEKTPLGRYLYATGGNRQAARLAGLRVERIMFGALMTSATIAALTGVVLAAKLGTAAPDIGPSYLLPAFSAVFLGSTQIRAGRVNVLGTLIAIYLLATGVKGLQLAGAPSYVNDLFNGLALIIAVALAARTARRN